MQSFLEPDLLRSFVAIAEMGSFTAAAQRVHRTQSAVSMQIKRLEEQVGRDLFLRDGRSVQLTREGELLLVHARKILLAHQEALTALDPEALDGSVTFGLPDDYAECWLPRILARFAETNPLVHVDVVCNTSVKLRRAVEHGRVDLALVTMGSEDGRGTLVRRDPLVWVTSAKHCVHEKVPVPLAVFDEGCLFRRYAEEGLGRIGRKGRIAYTSISTPGILAAIEAGLAVSVIMRGNVRQGMRILGEADGFPTLPEIGRVMIRAEGTSRPVIERLEAHVTEALSVTPGAWPSLSLAA